jgi:alkanesulfonate monooxygenase SsuD/methylene tetrahydromethanopterin reductase-like flavin-dependent oxidoreductase (luciferase family)
MRIGILLLQDAPWAVLRERAVRADELGFDTIWVGDHLVEPYHPEADWLEAWTLLGALAAVTRHASLGALASSLTLRNPALLVQATQTLRDISGGRAELALGAGGAPLDHQMTGTPNWTPAERADRFAEFVPLVAGLLRDGQVPDSPAPAGGRHYAIDNARLRNAGGVRLTVAGLGPRAIGLAARYGDAWNSYGVPTGKRLTGRLLHSQAVELFRQRVERFRGACLEWGRDPATIGGSYLWIDSFLEPQLPEPPACAQVAREFRDAGATEFIVYWPRDSAQVASLGELQRLIAEL